MADRSKEYLTWHFHDFVCVDWQYSREKQRLRIHIRENWDRDENSDAFCLEFEGIRYYAMEAESRNPISPLFWIISTAGLKRPLKFGFSHSLGQRTLVEGMLFSTRYL